MSQVFLLLVEVLHFFFRVLSFSYIVEVHDDTFDYGVIQEIAGDGFGYAPRAIGVANAEFLLLEYSPALQQLSELPHCSLNVIRVDE
jgi:hypothetical protein